MSDTHPAAQANINSFAAVVAKDKEAWLNLFADNAVVEDPVGISGLDPVGKGQQGRQAIAAFWDMTIAGNDVSFDVKMRVPRGDECAVMTSLINRMPGGDSLETEMIVVYRVDSAGKIVSLRAFWDYDSLVDKMAKMVESSQSANG